jgi:hypothetical protein
MAVGNGFSVAFVQHEPTAACSPLQPVEFGRNLRDCQRYFSKSGNYAVQPLNGDWETIGTVIPSSTVIRGFTRFPVQMAKVPTMVFTGTATTTGQIYLDSVPGNVAVASSAPHDSGIQSISLSATAGAGFSVALGCWTADTAW